VETLGLFIDNLLLTRSLKNTEVITVIGSGGKTSLIWHMAASLARAGRKVLVSPTTKMFPPSREIPGVTVEGRLNEASGKLESLPPEDLEKLVADYDYVLLEGDGANGLPLKAWADHEPVVPHYTTFTIGVLPLWPLGKPVSEKLVHRLPLFTELTGAAAGETLTVAHIISIITGRPVGLFAKTHGKRLLFFSHAVDEKAVRKIEEIVKLLPAYFHSQLSGIIYGNTNAYR